VPKTYPLLKPPPDFQGFGGGFILVLVILVLTMKPKGYFIGDGEIIFINYAKVIVI
jgi:hypothetical protein